MKRYCVNMILAVAIALSSLASAATAGTVIQLETVIYGETATSGGVTVYLEPDRMRIDSREGGADMTVIYNGKDPDNPYYWLINNYDTNYVEVRKQELIEAKAVAKRRYETAREQLDQMEPAQREQAERMLADQMGLASFFEAQTEYKKVSDGIKLRDWRCNHYQGFRDGKKVEEVWSATLNELGIDPRDLASLEDLADFFRTVGQNLPAFFRFSGDEGETDNSFPGFPVVIVGYESGKQREKSTVQSVESKKLSPSMFELPPGAVKQGSLSR